MAASCSCTHGNDRTQHLAERLAGIDDTRVHRDQGVLAREAQASIRRTGPADRLPGQVHEVGGVALVQDAEPAAQTKPLPVLAEQPMGEGMEGAGVDPAGQVGADQVAEAADQLVGGPPAEGHQHQAVGRHPGVDQAGQPGHQGAGLAGARSGHDQQGRPVVVDRPALRVVQAEGPSRIHAGENSAESNGCSPPE